MSNNLHLVTGYAGEEHVTSADMGSYNAAMLGNGEYVLERGNQFAASIISNNKVKVLDGDLMMQGRHVRLQENTYVELDFENGTQGYKRNDLIVARYTKDNTTGVESCNLVVIKGTPSTSAASDPAYTTGDIINDHVEINDMPLHRVPFDGLNMQSLVPLFGVLPTWKTLEENAINNINQQWVLKEIEIDSIVAEKIKDTEQITKDCVKGQNIELRVVDGELQFRYLTDDAEDSDSTGDSGSTDSGGGAVMPDEPVLDG